MGATEILDLKLRRQAGPQTEVTQNQIGDDKTGRSFICRQGRIIEDLNRTTGLQSQGRKPAVIMLPTELTLEFAFTNIGQWFTGASAG